MNDITVTRLDNTNLDHFVQLIKVFEDVFEMKEFSMPSLEYLQNMLNQDKFNVFCAVYKNKVIGGLTLYILDQYYSTKPLAYIYDLAIKREFQRQGIGKMLIADVKKFCLEKGFEEVFVQADKPDEYALEFYRSTNPTAEEEVIHFYYRL